LKAAMFPHRRPRDQSAPRLTSNKKQSRAKRRITERSRSTTDSLESGDFPVSPPTRPIHAKSNAEQRTEPREAEPCRADAQRDRLT
jgi:hypothetical protein